MMVDTSGQHPVNRRDSFLPFALPDIDHTEIAEVTEALKSGWITTGPRVQRFEALFAASVNAKHAVAVNSCTAALHLALEAIGLKCGDEVLTTPYTFAATAEVIRYFGARPVLVDVDERSLNLRPDLLEAAVTPRTKAVLPVHIGGSLADMVSICDIARRHDLRVIEDAAHTLPSQFRIRARDAVGDIACFSFYATKTITTGEGGMVCTDDDRWADRCRIMALHGISRDAWKRYTEEGSWYYEVIAPGFKYNMTDVAAAMGIAQLSKAERMRSRREAIARQYGEALSLLPELQIPHESPECQHSWHLYMLRLNLDSLLIDRARFAEELKARNIGISVHFIPLHIHPYYRETYGYQPEDFPVAYHQYLREISLPIYSKMTDQDVSDVIEAVTDVAQAFRR